MRIILIVQIVSANFAIIILISNSTIPQNYQQLINTNPNSIIDIHLLILLTQLFTIINKYNSPHFYQSLSSSIVDHFFTLNPLYPPTSQQLNEKYTLSLEALRLKNAFSIKFSQLQYYYYFIKHKFMKDRMVYSPKPHRPYNQFDINFKKSPQKFMLYDPPSELKNHPQLPSTHYYPLNKDFDNVKKVSEEASSLRHTMNVKKAEQIAKRQLLHQMDQKSSKLNEFLRQTMSYKSTKAFSQKFNSDFTNTNEKTIQKEDIFNNQKSLKSQDFLRYGESKSSTNLIESQRSLNQYELGHDKIDRNKNIIEQLRKPIRDDKNYLKNVVHNRSPTYLDLDRQKQMDEKGFRKKKKEEVGSYMTPKLDKGTYASRFNSSPLIPQNKAKQQQIQKPIISSPTINSTTITSPAISSPILKKKLSINNNTQKTMMIDQFQIGKKLGEGKFGCVNLARHKKTSGLFALKKIPKNLIKSHMMVDQLALEIRLQSCLQHKNILGMYGFFDDKTHFYIVLEYMDGGTLYQKLKKGKISEKQTAGIIRNITQSIDYLHDLGIAHRDLKPQNIVISNNVYKLCDFGWAAMCNQRRKTYCGTFDYVAPEILEGVDYDMTVDLWCLGVLTFELMTGKAPFYHISRKETMKKILNVQNNNIVYPETMSETARDFIDKLIRKNPQERIKTSQALLHPFIKDAQLD